MLLWRTQHFVAWITAVVIGGPIGFAQAKSDIVSAMRQFENQYSCTSFRYDHKMVYAPGPALDAQTMVAEGSGLCLNDGEGRWQIENIRACY